MKCQLGFSFLHALFSPACLGCARKLRPGSSAFCHSCIRFLLGAPRLKGALFEHEGPGKGLLSALRETAPQRAAAWALELLKRKRFLHQWRGQGVELVVNAPQARRKGLSGLSLLAQGVARELDVAFSAQAFHKVGIRTQHGKSREARMDTACFIELACPGSWVNGKRVLLLDDVNTTGTTLELCAYVLRNAGAAKVFSFSLTRQMVNSFDRKEENSG